MMKRVLLIFVSCADAFHPAAPMLSATRYRRSPLLVADTAAKDYSGEASNLFNNVRTPAALVAGATFGAVFALQPAYGDAKIIGLAKRVHMLLGVAAFSAELIAVLVSSITLGRLGSKSLSGASSGASSVTEFIDLEYELELSLIHI